MIRQFLILLMFAPLCFAEEPIIQSEDLAPVNPETYGSLETEANDIPLDIWEDLTHQQISHLLQSLPAHQENPIMARLQKRLVTAATKIPEPEEGEESILKLRVLTLIKTFDIEQAYLLSKPYPDVLGEDLWAWVKFSYFLSIENMNQAQTITQGALTKNPDDQKWAKAMITLQLLKGKKKEALFSISLLEEHPNSKNALFLETAKNLANDTPITGGFHPTDILEFKLWIMGQKDQLFKIPEHFLPLVLMDKNFRALTPKEKLLVAERAFQERYLSQENFLQLYHASCPKEAEPSVTESSGDDIHIPPPPFDWEKNDPLTRAELYAKIDRETDILEKAKLLKQFGDHAKTYGHEGLLKLLRPHVKTIPVDESLRETAPLFAKVLLETGDIDLALQWINLLNDEQRLMLAPLILIMVDSLSLEAKQNLFAQWYERYTQQDTDPKHQLMVIGLFEAIIPGVTKRQGILISPPQDHVGLTMPALLWQSQFAQQSQRGMALVYTLRLAQEVLAADHDALMPVVVRGLMDLGHVMEAKQLALWEIPRCHG